MRSPSQQLKDIARRHRWAFRELVYDCKMIEANRLCSGPVIQAYRYLAQFGARVEIAVSVHEELAGQKIRVPAFENDKQLLEWAGKKYPWVFGDMCVEVKQGEAIQMFGSANVMYAYLKEVYGSMSKVQQNLLALVVGQRKPLKTIWLQSCKNTQSKNSNRSKQKR